MAVWKLALSIAISLVLHVLVKRLAQMTPSEPAVDLAEVPRDMLARAAVRANRVGTLAALLVFVLLAPAWIACGYLVDPLVLPEVAADELIAVPLHLGRWLRGCVASYALAGLAAMWVMRWWIGPTYYLSINAGNDVYGFSASRFFYWAIVWVVPFCIEYELHAMGRYTVLSRTELIESESLLWPATHRPWKTLSKIELAKPFVENPAAIGRSPECRLTFADDATWSEIPWLRPYRPGGATQSWEEACSFVSRHSQRPVQVVARLERRWSDGW